MWLFSREPFQLFCGMVIVMGVPSLQCLAVIGGITLESLHLPQESSALRMVLEVLKKIFKLLPVHQLEVKLLGQLFKDIEVYEGFWTVNYFR